MNLPAAGPGVAERDEVADVGRDEHTTFPGRSLEHLLVRGANQVWASGDRFRVATGRGQFDRDGPWQHLVKQEHRQLPSSSRWRSAAISAACSARSASAMTSSTSSG